VLQSTCRVVRLFQNQVNEIALECSLNVDSIVSRDTPFVSGIVTAQTTRVRRVAKPKKKYTPNEDLARRIGVVNATIQFESFIPLVYGNKARRY